MPTYHDNDPGHTNAHNDHVTQIAAVQASVATKADAGHGHGEAEITNLVIDLADHSSRLTSLEDDRSTRVLVLAPGDPVPDGTPSGTVILRTA
jgi:hypothetical protein